MFCATFIFQTRSSIFGNNFVDDVFDDMFPFAGNYITANYDLMKTDVY